MSGRRLALALLLIASFPILLGAQTPAPASRPRLVVPPGAAAGSGFDPLRATDAYLATMPPDARARSDAYFEGGYWIQLWGVLYNSAALWLILSLGWSAAMRDRAVRLSPFPSLRVAAYWIQLATVMAVVTFPLGFYTDFVREHQYGMATQTFGPWFGDQAKGFGVMLIAGSLVTTALYAVLRRVGASWWLWASGVAVLFSAVGGMIAPVYIAPLFNTYTRLADETIRTPVLSMARANGIPAEDVYVVDASRQTRRISANVSGLGGTMRISLNDNLLNRSSAEEIEAVLGHEMGHYVLNHAVTLLLETALLTAAGFAVVAWLFERVRRRYPRWGVGSIADVAGLPLFALLFGVYQFAATPINNTIVRTAEQEADMFGLNAARQPDGFANAALKLGEYRKLAPGPIEEFIFFDHPSGRTRIFNAMRWKKEQKD
jgi:Zn-dependent protease with chaperone function